VLFSGYRVTGVYLARGLDVLVLDALRYTPHPSHFTVKEALAVIEEIKPRRAILTNLHIDLDYETLRRELPEGVEPAYDGMRMNATKMYCNPD
jgi:phosphoribosyl 1,2-cyclic phosphate phosphodiesterase